MLRDDLALNRPKFGCGLAQCGACTVTLDGKAQRFHYRERSGIAAKLAVVGMTATGLTIADPEDPGMLDVVGFDAAAPRLISEFAVPDRPLTA